MNEDYSDNPRLVATVVGTITKTKKGSYVMDKLVNVSAHAVASSSKAPGGGAVIDQAALRKKVEECVANWPNAHVFALETAECLEDGQAPYVKATLKVRSK